MHDPVIEEIKDRVDIVDLIGNYIPLKKSGVNYKANCPFHGEKTPSFMVNRERQMFRCFGCGEAGDIFAFVMKQENIDFPNALQLLAQKAGISLPEKTKRQHSNTPHTDRAQLQAINGTAAKFFHQVLVSHPSGKPALDYLLKRGVTMEFIKTFQIGYAPQSNQALQTLFAKQSYHPTAIRNAGSPERFRDRIMFPFRDVLGNVIGFSGRALQAEQMPKYLNTSETSLFRKNRFLYGLFEAKKALATSQKILLVEGQLDLVLAHQSGTAYTVATSGTALTDDHLKIMRRYTDILLLALDNDSAGQKATLRAIEMALKHEFEVSVISLPEGTDPGEVIAKQLDYWNQAVAKPKAAIEWLFSYYFPEATRPSPDDRQKIFSSIFPYIEIIKDPMYQWYCFQKLSASMGISQQSESIREAYKEWKQITKKESSTNEKKEEKTSTIAPPISLPKKDDPLLTKERYLLGLIILMPELLSYNNFQLDDVDFVNTTLARLYKSAKNWYNKATDSKSSQVLITHLESELDASGKKSLQKLLFDTQTYVGDFSPEQFLHEYSTLVQTIRSRLREQRIQSFAERIAQAEAAGDRSLVLKLMQEMQQTAKKDL